MGIGALDSFKAKFAFEQFAALSYRLDSAVIVTTLEIGVYHGNKCLLALSVRLCVH